MVSCPQDLEEYKYTCEPGHMEWTPLNSNLTMQGIKASNFFFIRKNFVVKANISICPSNIVDFFFAFSLYIS